MQPVKKRAIEPSKQETQQLVQVLAPQPPGPARRALQRLDTDALLLVCQFLSTADVVNLAPYAFVDAAARHGVNWVPLFKKWMTLFLHRITILHVHGDQWRRLAQSPKFNDWLKINGPRLKTWMFRDSHTVPGVELMKQIVQWDAIEHLDIVVPALPADFPIETVRSSPEAASFRQTQPFYRALVRCKQLRTLRLDFRDMHWQLVGFPIVMRTEGNWDAKSSMLRKAITKKWQLTTCCLQLLMPWNNQEVDDLLLGLKQVRVLSLNVQDGGHFLHRLREPTCPRLQSLDLEIYTHKQSSQLPLTEGFMESLFKVCPLLERLHVYTSRSSYHYHTQWIEIKGKRLQVYGENTYESLLSWRRDVHPAYPSSYWCRDMLLRDVDQYVCLTHSRITDEWDTIDVTCHDPWAFVEFLQTRKVRMRHLSITGLYVRQPNDEKAALAMSYLAQGVQQTVNLPFGVSITRDVASRAVAFHMHQTFLESPTWIVLKHWPWPSISAVHLKGQPDRKSALVSFLASLLQRHLLEQLEWVLPLDVEQGTDTGLMQLIQSQPALQLLRLGLRVDRNVWVEPQKTRLTVVQEEEPGFKTMPFHGMRFSDIKVLAAVAQLKYLTNLELHVDGVIEHADLVRFHNLTVLELASHFVPSVAFDVKKLVSNQTLRDIGQRNPKLHILRLLLQTHAIHSDPSLMYVIPVQHTLRELSLVTHAKNITVEEIRALFESGSANGELSIDLYMGTKTYSHHKPCTLQQKQASGLRRAGYVVTLYDKFQSPTELDLPRHVQCDARVQAQPKPVESKTIPKPPVSVSTEKKKPIVKRAAVPVFGSITTTKEEKKETKTSTSAIYSTVDQPTTIESLRKSKESIWAVPQEPQEPDIDALQRYLDQQLIEIRNRQIKTLDPEATQVMTSVEMQVDDEVIADIHASMEERTVMQTENNPAQLLQHLMQHRPVQIDTRRAEACVHRIRLTHDDAHYQWKVECVLAAVAATANNACLVDRLKSHLVARVQRMLKWLYVTTHEWRFLQPIHILTLTE